MGTGTTVWAAVRESWPGPGQGRLGRLVCECVCVCVCVVGMGVGVGVGVGDHQDQEDGQRQEERQETRDKQPGGQGRKLCHLYSLYVLLTLPMVIQYRPRPPTHARAPRVLGCGIRLILGRGKSTPLGKGRDGRGEMGVGRRLLAFSVEEEKIRTAFPFAVSRPPPAQHRQGGARVLDSLAGMSEQPGAYTAPFGLQVPLCTVCTVYRIQNTAMYSAFLF